MDLTKEEEQEVFESIDEMCCESLCTDIFEQWESVKKQLLERRTYLNDVEYE